ncbi:hypothetical protein SASPL_118457 [Salvia splendens]|uniref:Uncharacterized protein n=2 Tax=Salvia splendens TaxID=180675 RepID=A0A4D8XSA4_SALSN|nr:uncharacterized protein LOC121791804 isoform X1 [Salvia splendens]KAG6382795.1 hypothetical protein SASPL_157496 [Salvia splendens]KAG6421898.1 hypothetical protein SASPL_118457 [Salvia splendens]
MAWRGSLSRSLMSAARASTPRSSPPHATLRTLRSPPLSSSRLNSRRFSFSNPSTLGELGCAQSLLSLHRTVAGTRLTSHLADNVRAFCELSHGTLCRSCQDR